MGLTSQYKHITHIHYYLKSISHQKSKSEYLHHYYEPCNTNQLNNSESWSMTQGTLLPYLSSTHPFSHHS